ncbi:MAG: flagellar hook-associated protein FlgL [Thermanaeromonas sp.]|uniref:flagellar hook-associated protein FlgL n=1 Tax=Thermanaeromonas sp. TaxID=2003697 RepID=UPI0024374DE7|nr:flagellar hook-associated protein FlgL [Thermanaeromonas sp.]MCG0278677.1 flagellar hook-associated protein FlgL [Thermanaeromonas sp.]
MRITNRMLISNVLTNINNNLKVMSNTQKQMSSGKRVSRPSDDPIVVARVLSFKSALDSMEQYDKNMQDARGWVDASESALSMATETLQRARELAVYGANGTLPKESMQALAHEIDQLIDELVQTANTSYGGRFLFGGSYTTKAPFERTSDGDVIYKGNTHSLEWEIAPLVTITVNEDGEKVFMKVVDVDGDGNPDSSIFYVLNKLYEALGGKDPNSADHAEVAGTLGLLDQAIDHLLNIRASLGARSNRLQMSQDRLFNSKISLTETMSKLEDIDLAEAVMNYKNQENVYQAALATAAMVLQPTLIDYLR